MTVICSLGNDRRHLAAWCETQSRLIGKAIHHFTCHYGVQYYIMAVTPEGFWCCPSPVVFQKGRKFQTPLNNKPKPFSPPLLSKNTAKKIISFSYREESSACYTTPSGLVAALDVQKRSDDLVRHPAATSMAIIERNQTNKDTMMPALRRTHGYILAVLFCVFISMAASQPIDPSEVNALKGIKKSFV